MSTFPVCKRIMECIINNDCLPDEIIANILTFLPIRDRITASLTCKSWYRVLNSPLCWQFVVFRFTENADECWLNYMKRQGHHIKNLCIEVEQSQQNNRENAISALKCLSQLSHRRLQSFRFICVGENPLFYAGKELVDGVADVFNAQSTKSTLKHVDLAHFPMLFDDSLIDRLSEHHPNLEYLDIQNAPYVCKVGPSCILRLVTRCSKLKDLRLMKCSLSEEALLALADKCRAMKHLSIKCRREEKYMNNIWYEREQLPSAIWAKLADSLPDLRVTLHFDKTCPLNMVSVVMKPEVPCSVLRLQTYTMLHEQVSFAADCYNRTLEKVVLDTHPSRELNSAVLKLSRRCTKLKALHVFCPLDSAIIDQILEEHPEMRESGSFTLESRREAFMC